MQQMKQNVGDKFFLETWMAMNQLTLILNVYVVMYLQLNVIVVFVKQGFNPFLFSSNNNFIDYYSINIIYIIQ